MKFLAASVLIFALATLSMITAQIVIPPIPSISFSIPPIPSISFSIPPIPSFTFYSMPGITIPPNPAVNNLPKSTGITPPLDAPEDNCEACISTNLQSVPACQALTNYFNLDTTTPGGMSSPEKACYCSLVTDLSWFQKCKGPDSCSDLQISSMEQNFTKARGTVSCVAALELESSTSLIMNQYAIGMVLTTLITAMLL
ncbi:hypothetical protein BG006_007761 [Podila minutissima]|uniref:Uncharacterized protein n=1 Tax=Podila minutissima TaxID=64525 RepID=A0A9P5VQC7_9FUNG|nr:hypothetical protein BG006_007761 [Podila minutissima]